jgi:hypothetical protein
MLTEDFQEFGSSGQVYSKDQIIGLCSQSLPSRSPGLRNSRPNSDLEATGRESPELSCNSDLSSVGLNDLSGNRGKDVPTSCYRLRLDGGVKRLHEVAGDLRFEDVTGRTQILSGLNEVCALVNRQKDNFGRATGASQLFRD